MTKNYTVGIHIDDDFGHIEYNEQSKKIVVLLADESICQIVENYLLTEQTINVAQNSLLDFKEISKVPISNLNNFKLALTGLWNKTGVFVDWSRPICK